MRYAQIRSMDISNGEGLGIALFTNGCRFHCYNCFNSELWDVNGGKAWDKMQEEYFLSLAKPDYIKRISILGGEPFLDENLDDLYNLLKHTKEMYKDKQIWIYSGYLYEELLKKARNILDYCDVLVDGKYVDSLRDYKLKFRGSSNQRVIDVKKSLKENKVILYLD